MKNLTPTMKKKKEFAKLPSSVPICSSHKWQLYDLEKDEIIAENNSFLVDWLLIRNQDKIDLNRLDYLFIFRDGKPWGKFIPSYKVVAVN